VVEVVENSGEIGFRHGVLLRFSGHPSLYLIRPAHDDQRVQGFQRLDMQMTTSPPISDTRWIIP
jgi:hypothetical protein